MALEPGAEPDLPVTELWSATNFQSERSSSLKIVHIDIEVLRAMASKRVPEDSIALGRLIGSRSAKQLSVPFQQLNSHLVVTGGTNYARFRIGCELLNQLRALKVPFIVLETKGRKYRSLMAEPEWSGQLLVHTAGNQGLAPIAINPFELLTSTTLHAHIARTALMFQDVLGLSEQSTAVLQRSIALAYERFGWNLLEPFANVRTDNYEHAPELIPSFADVLEFVDQAITDAQTGAKAIDETRNRLTRSLQRYCYGNERLIFGKCSATSIKALLHGCHVVELGDLSDPRDSLLAIGTLLNVAAESGVSQNGQSRTVIVVDDAQQLLESAQSPFSSDPGSSWLRRCLGELTEMSTAVCLFTHGRGFKRSDRGIVGCKLVLGEELSAAPVKPVLTAIKDKDEPAKVEAGKAVFNCKDWDGPVWIKLSPPSTESAVVPDAEIAALWENQLSRNAPLLASGEKYYPSAFKPKPLFMADRVVGDKRYYGAFISYIQATTDDLTQLVHFRRTIVDELQRVVGNAKGLLTEINWCAFSLATDQYFAEKGRFHQWSLEQERQIRAGWYDLAAIAFIPTGINRRLDIEVIRKWRDDFRALQERRVGPFPVCLRCKNPCMSGYDAEQLLDWATRAEFNRSISQRFGRASETVAWFSKILTERFIGVCNLELAYCLAAHLVKEQDLSFHAQEILMDRVSRLLYSEGGEKEGEADSEQAN